MYDDLPSYFNQKYNPFCGSLPDIIAVIAGIKPLTRLSFSRNNKTHCEFVKFVGRYGVFAAESQFGEKKKYLPDTGENNLKHLYLSKSKRILEKYRSGDPDLEPLETGNPSKSKKIEFQKFAKDLGYPDCCVNNYLKNGQHKTVVSYKNFTHLNRAPFYMNNFLHSISNFYLSFHLPCSLNCEKTKAYNKKIFGVIHKLEPEFAKQLKKTLAMPLMVWFNKSALPFDDRVVALFDGTLAGNVLRYSKCFILRTNFPNNKEFPRAGAKNLSYLRTGDKLENTKNEIHIYQGGKLTHVIKKQSEHEGILFDFN